MSVWVRVLSSSAMLYVVRSMMLACMMAGVMNTMMSTTAAVVRDAMCNSMTTSSMTTTTSRICFQHHGRFSHRHDVSNDGRCISKDGRSLNHWHGFSLSL